MNKVASKTRQARQKETAEIFTPNAMVNEMLDQLPQSVWGKNKTFLDPASGNGQFLVWVLIRKIQRGIKPLDALKSLYGVDLMTDNTEECRGRLLQIARVFGKITSKHIIAVLSNVVCKDSLKYDFEFDDKPTQKEIDRWMRIDFSKGRHEVIQEFTGIIFPKKIKAEAIYSYEAA